MSETWKIFLKPLETIYMYITNNDDFNKNYSEYNLLSVTTMPILEIVQNRISNFKVIKNMNEGIKDLIIEKVSGAKDLWSKFEVLDELVERNENALWISDKCIKYVFASKPLFAIFSPICCEYFPNTFDTPPFIVNYIEEVLKINNQLSEISGKIYAFANEYYIGIYEAPNLLLNSTFDVAGDVNINIYAEDGAA